MFVSMKDKERQENEKREKVNISMANRELSSSSQDLSLFHHHYLPQLDNGCFALLKDY